MSLSLSHQFQGELLQGNHHFPPLSRLSSGNFRLPTDMDTVTLGHLSAGKHLFCPTLSVEVVPLDLESALGPLELAELGPRSP